MQSHLRGVAVFPQHSRLQDDDREHGFRQGRHSEARHMKLKTTHSTRAANRGKILFATLVLIGVVGLALASYLSLMQNRAQLASRSQSWNQAMPIAEAGVEEAMAHLNQNQGKN